MKRIVCILTLVLPLLAAAQAPADTTHLLQQPAKCFDQRSDSTDGNIPDPDKFQEVDLPPRPLNLEVFAKCLVYPRSLVKKKIEGRVLVKVLVNENGEPLDHIIQKTPHVDFAEPVAKCLYLLRFSPALVRSKPLRFFWVVVPVDFTLSDSKQKKN